MGLFSDLIAGSGNTAAASNPYTGAASGLSKVLGGSGTSPGVQSGRIGPVTTGGLTVQAAPSNAFSGGGSVSPTVLLAGGGAAVVLVAALIVRRG